MAENNNVYSLIRDNFGKLAPFTLDKFLDGGRLCIFYTKFTDRKETIQYCEYVCGPDAENNVAVLTSNNLLQLYPMADLVKYGKMLPPFFVNNQPFYEENSEYAVCADDVGTVTIIATDPTKKYRLSFDEL